MEDSIEAKDKHVNAKNLLRRGRKTRTTQRVKRIETRKREGKRKSSYRGTTAPIKPGAECVQ